MLGEASEGSLFEKSEVCVLPKLSEAEIKEVKAQLDNESVDIRRSTCWMLADNLGLAKAVLPQIINLLHEACLVRRAAIELLGRIGPGAAPAVPQLIELLGIEDCYGRQAIVRALKEIGFKDDLLAPAELVSGSKIAPMERRETTARIIKRVVESFH